MPSRNKRVLFGNSTPQNRQLKSKTVFDINSPYDVLQLQLKLCKRLQTSLDLDDLLDIFQDTMPSAAHLCAIDFIPLSLIEFETTALFAGHQYKLQLYAGKDAIGYLWLNFSLKPSAEFLKLIENSAELLAFPLRHALAMQEAVRFSELDLLTGLKNRNAMNHAITQACDSAKRYGLQLSILMIDIDNFKLVNDSYGHLCGDKVLQKLAEIINLCCRLADQAFRFGGEEFLMVLQSTDHKGALETAERLRKAIETHNFNNLFDEQLPPITISVGVTKFQVEDSVESLITRADQALYAAKRQGRNRSVLLPQHQG